MKVRLKRHRIALVVSAHKPGCEIYLPSGGCDCHASTQRYFNVHGKEVDKDGYRI